MINFLSDWIQKIAIGVVIVSVFELIIPNGNLKKYIKVVLGIYVVFCIISPFINNSSFTNFDEKNLENYLENITKTNSTSSHKTSENSNIQELYINELKNNIEKQIKNSGYKMEKCSIDADLVASSSNPGIHKIDLVVEKENKSSINKIEINLNNEVEEKVVDENNNPELMKLKQTLADYYEINKDKINIKMK